jgi:thymidine kinase
MFAGKSSELLGTIRKYSAIGWPVFVITHSFDKRYGTKPEVVSHDSERSPALAVSDFYGIFDMEDYKKAKLVIIEEAQFFDKLKEFVLTSVERDGKDVICVGLDGDAERRPFGELIELVPYCDSVVKRHAFCRRCQEPTPAIFTYRKTPDDSQVVVGGAETYEPLCRRHYLNYGS